MPATKMSLQPPQTTTFDVSFPEPGLMLVTINRPKHMNSIPMNGYVEGDALFEWFDSEPRLSVAVVTGAGPKAFCAGADLIEQRDRSTKVSQQQSIPASGFAGISRRIGKKPIIAAVNGFALGGGFEICLNW